MGHVRNNLVANFAGKAWIGCLNLATIPLYIKFVGIESYGLVGVYSTIQSALVLFDLGMGATMNRELARCSVIINSQYKMRDLVRTLEIIYWLIAATLGLAIFISSTFISRYWVKTQHLPLDTVQNAIRLMGLTLAFQWPISLYAGGLMGLQKQVLYNALNACMWTIRSLGAVLVLWLLSRSILSFFVWQLLASIINVIAIALMLWASLPRHGAPARFKMSIVGDVWRFSIKTWAISITIQLFNQMDKIILSKQLSLTMFGYYCVAWQVAGALFLLYMPVYSTFFPVFSQRVAEMDHEGLKEVYHRSCQIMSVLVLPVTAVVALFAPEMLLLWTGNPVLVENTHRLVTILMPGAALGALLYMPWSLQQAFGISKRVLGVFVTCLLVLVPLMIFSTARYGAIGAASTWVVVGLVQTILVIYWTHKKFLPGEHGRWYIQDVGRPLMAILVVVGIARLVVPGQISKSLIICSVTFILLLAVISAALATPTTWGVIKAYLPRMK